jgi:hypothetical protein
MMKRSESFWMEETIPSMEESYREVAVGKGKIFQEGESEQSRTTSEWHTFSTLFEAFSQARRLSARKNRWLEMNRRSFLIPKRRVHKNGGRLWRLETC